MTTTALLIAADTPPRGALEQKIAKTGIFDNLLICATADEALAYLQRELIDLICWAFSPQDVPPAWLEAVRRHPDWQDIPILVFTKDGETEAPHLAALRSQGCDLIKFIVPPVELTARIQGHLKRAEQISRLRNRRAQMAQMALNDPLTGLGNRTAFDLRLRQEISHSRRSGSPLVLMLLDLDQFKWINNCYGRQAGDAILKAVSKALQSALRDSDIPCRYGGEEFALIMPATSVRSARQMADRIHAAMADLSAQLWQNQKTLTLSIGMSCFDGERRAASGDLLAEADEALLEAQKKGLNQTETYCPLPVSAPGFFEPKSAVPIFQSLS